MDADEIAKTVMDPTTRTLKQITMEDASEVANMFNALMGDSAVLRKVFIEKNATKAEIDV